MSNISKPTTFTSNTTISSSAVNDNFDTIYNEFNGGISSANIADNAVATAKIPDSAVTTAKLADGAVTAAKLATPVAFSASVTGTTGNLAYTGSSVSGTEVFDLGSNYASATFTAPYDGVYSFTARAGIDNHAGRLLVSIKKGGAVQGDGFMYAGSSINDPVVTVTLLLSLSATNTITVDVGSETSGQTITSGNFSGHLVGRTD